MRISTLMNEIKEELNKWIDIPCLWIGRLNTVKMSVLSNFKVIPITISTDVFVANDKKQLIRIYMEKQRHRTVMSSPSPPAPNSSQRQGLFK